MIEVFSGSGGMAAAFRDLGFLTLAIDKASNVHRLKHSFVPLDLTRSDHQKLLLSTLDDAALVGVIHLGVPCGTCFRKPSERAPADPSVSFRAIQVASKLPAGDQFQVLASSLGETLQGQNLVAGQRDNPNGRADDIRDQIRFGIRWTPAEFLEQAKKVTHPMNPEKSLHPLLKETLFDNLTRDPLQLAKQVAEFRPLSRSNKWLRELEEQENSTPS